MRLVRRARSGRIWRVNPVTEDDARPAPQTRPSEFEAIMAVAGGGQGVR